MAVTSNLAGLARVAYETTGLAEFRADNDAAERAYVGATSHMSDSAIKLELAQEKLRRALAKGPSASREQARALLSVRQAERELESQTHQTTRELARQDRELARAGGPRGGIARLTRSAVGLGAAFIGTSGLLYGLDQAKDVASNLEEQVDKTRRVFGSASVEVERYAKNALGLANDEALEFTSTLGALLRPIGLVGQESAKLSTDLIKRGVDLSSFYNRDVKDAIEAVRSGIVGETEPLRNFGVRLSEARVQALALQQTGKESVKQLTDEEKIRARVAIIFKDSDIAANNYRQTIGGVANQEKEAASSYRDTQAAIGRALIPAYRDVLAQVSAYLGKQENQERIQRQVTEAVEAGTKAVHGIAGGLKIAKEAAEPLVDALGGVENTVKALTLLWVAFKAKALLGFGGTAAASRATSASMVRDATVAGRAWDIATRPRVMPVTTTGGGTTTTGGRGGGGGGRGRGLPSLPTIFANTLGRNVAIAEIIALSQTPGATGGRTAAYSPARYPNVARLIAKVEAGQPLTANEQSAIREFGGRSISELTPSQLARLNTNLVGQATGFGDRDRPNMGRAIDTPERPSRTRSGGGNRPSGEGLSRIQRLELAAQQAELTKDLQDDLRAARALEAHYAKLAANENLTGDRLFQARQDMIAAQQRTQGIEDQIATDRQEGIEKANKRRRDAAEKRKAARKKAAEAAQKLRVEEAQQEAMLNAPPDLKHIAGIAGMRGEAMARAFGRDPEEIRRQDDARRKAQQAKAASSSDADRLREEFGSVLREFMQWQTDILRNSSNVMGGNLSTHVLEQLTREQTGVLKTAVGPARGMRRDLDESVMAW